MNPFKISGGIFSILLGVILLSIFQNKLLGTTEGTYLAITGAVSIAIGFGLIAWDFSDEKN